MLKRIKTRKLEVAEPEPNPLRTLILLSALLKKLGFHSKLSLLQPPFWARLSGLPGPARGTTGRRWSRHWGRATAKASLHPEVPGFEEITSPTVSVSYMQGKNLGVPECSLPHHTSPRTRHGEEFVLERSPLFHSSSKSL